jgi:peptidoglycan/xylan/chitin deacetylase (PgdA/CDA1 family)
MDSGDLVKRMAGWAAVGLRCAGRREFSGGLGILVYHRISPRVPGVVAPSMNVTPRSFCRQLESLQRLGFTFLSLQDALASHARGDDWPHKSLVVTFDDGFANVHQYALPVLRRHGIPATVFLNTAFLNSDAPFPFDDWALARQGQIPREAYRPLRVAECREMLDSRWIELGAHTHTHRNFRGQPRALRDDLAVCVRELDRLFAIGRPTFAFPFGRVALGFAGGELTESARATGVACALTTECVVNEKGSDPFHWGRFNVYDWDTARTLEAKLCGTYGWIPKLQERLSRWRTSPAG